MTAHNRRWRFSLRTLFVAITVFCCWLGWQFNTIHQRKRMLERIAKDNGYILTVEAMRDTDGKNYQKRPNAGAFPFWRAWLGDTPMHSVGTPMEIDADLDLSYFYEAERLFPEAEVVQVPTRESTVQRPQ